MVVLPGGLVAAAVVQAVVIISSIYFLWLPAVITRAVGSYVMPFAFVVWGAAIAPTFKLQTAALLAVVAILLSGIALGASLVLYSDAPAKLELLLAAVLGAAGSVHGIFQTYKEERRKLWTMS